MADDDHNYFPSSEKNKATSSCDKDVSLKDLSEKEALLEVLVPGTLPHHHGKVPIKLQNKPNKDGSIAPNPQALTKDSKVGKVFEIGTHCTDNDKASSEEKNKASSGCDKDISANNLLENDALVVEESLLQEQKEVTIKLQTNRVKDVSISTNPLTEDSELLEVEKSLITKASYEGSDEKKNRVGRKDRCSCLTPQYQMYISHFLSSWGDRMWMFAGGLFLIEITPGSFRLVAVYESAISLTVIFLGSTIGRWVDRTSRLQAAQFSLIVQNLMVCACTCLLCLLISYEVYFVQSLNGWGAVVAQAVVVFLACVAQTGSLGSTISIEKDWIMVISENRNVKLSTMNSVLRTVDLSTELVAPVFVGFVMSSAGMVIGGVVIAAWNVTSLIFEYGLLYQLYYRVPALQKPKETGASPLKSRGKSVSDYLGEIKVKAVDAAVTWKLYFHHEIRDAGLALAFLFMTVLSLNNYTRAYVYESGVSKSVLGILTACASLCGICGSLTFPHFRKKIGVMKTGIFGFCFQASFLVLCVAAVFVPGTSFQPLYPQDSRRSQTTLISVDPLTAAVPLQVEVPLRNESLAKAPPVSNNSIQVELVEDIESAHDHADVPDVLSKKNYTSATLLMTGIIISRFGLWLADLTVTQLLQEQVSENERGGINGVQFSLNQIFSFLRSILLIILPAMDTFGYLILLSFGFVVLGTIMFCAYVYQTWRKSLP